jgi:protein-tyrosine phosphatase
VDALVCLLTREEMAELDITEEADCCSASGIHFVSFPVPDRGVPPSEQATLSTVQKLATLLTEGKSVTVHCRQGVGRSALIAACVLAALGDKPEVAFERIAQARGCPVPDTPAQREWVKQFVDRYLTEAGA